MFFFCRGALHYLISLHCAARSGTASASTSLFFFFELFFSCGKSRIFFLNNGKKPFVSAALSRIFHCAPENSRHFSLATIQQSDFAKPKMMAFMKKIAQQEAAGDGFFVCINFQ